MRRDYISILMLTSIFVMCLVIGYAVGISENVGRYITPFINCEK